MCGTTDKEAGFMIVRPGNSHKGKVAPVQQKNLTVLH